jgi:hypothetical protein
MVQKAKDTRSRVVKPWEPLFMDPKRWEREIERIAEEFFGRKMQPWWPSISPWRADREFIAPAVDVYEEKDNIGCKGGTAGC